MQKVFSEIRKHGNADKHLSGGERSMLSGFQEAAQKVQDKDEYEYAMIPFWMFYDTAHAFLDSSIKRVIERAERAAIDNKGLESIMEPIEITRKISEMIFENIYRTKKFRYEKKYDFEFDKKVDGVNYGNPVEGMKLEILTTATSEIDKQELRLMTESHNKVLIVLGETEYYNFIENAMKIEKFARKKNIPQLPIQGGTSK